MAVQKQLGVDQPDFGMLFDDMAFADGETIPLESPAPAEGRGRGGDRAGARPRPRRLDAHRLIAATAYALPAIEIVGSRIADWKISLIDTIADNASSGVYAIGTVPRKLDAFDPRSAAW